MAEVCFDNPAAKCVTLTDANGAIEGDIKRVVVGNGGDLQCVAGSGLRTVIRRRHDKSTSGRVVVGEGVELVGSNPVSRTKGGQLSNYARVANPTNMGALAQFSFQGVLDCTLSPSEGADSAVEATIEWRWIQHNTQQDDPWTGFEGSWSWVSQEINKQRYGVVSTGGQAWSRSFRFTGVEEAVVSGGHFAYLDARLKLEALDGFIRWDSYVIVNQIFMLAMRN